MFHNIFLIIKKCEESIIGSCKVGIAIDTEKIIFVAKWSNELVLEKKLSMEEYSRSSISDEMYILLFAEQANKEYKKTKKS